MYIDEYILMHPELLPDGEDILEYSAKCEKWIPDCRDLFQYSAPDYVEQVFKTCIEMQMEYDKNNKHY